MNYVHLLLSPIHSSPLLVKLSQVMLIIRLKNNFVTSLKPYILIFKVKKRPYGLKSDFYKVYVVLFRTREDFVEMKGLEPNAATALELCHSNSWGSDIFLANLKKWG